MGCEECAHLKPQTANPAIIGHCMNKDARPYKRNWNARFWDSKICKCFRSRPDAWMMKRAIVGLRDIAESGFMSGKELAEGAQNVLKSIADWDKEANE